MGVGGKRLALMGILFFFFFTLNQPEKNDVENYSRKNRLGKEMFVPQL